MLKISKDHGRICAIQTSVIHTDMEQPRAACAAYEHRGQAYPPPGMLCACQRL